MSTVYAMSGPGPVAPAESHLVLQAWLRCWQGDALGLPTDPPNPPKPQSRPTTPEHTRLHNVASMREILIDQRLGPITGLATREADPV